MSVKKTRQGTYQARYRDAAGREHSKTFKTLQPAREWENDQKSAVRRGDWVNPKGPRMLFSEYAKGWQAQQLHRDSTARSREAIFRLHLEPAFGEKRMGQIRPSDIQAFVKRLSEEMKPSTVSVVFAYLSMVFRSAVLDRVLASNPCERVKVPKIEKPKIEAIPADEVERIIDFVPERLRAMFLLAATSGMRASELGGLQTSHVDFLRRQVKVERQILEGSPVRFGPPKSRAGHRTIPLPDHVLSELSEHVRRFPGELLFLTDARSVPVRTQTLSRWWLRADPPEGSSFHSLRHFYASTLIHQGCSVTQVQRVMGHESARVTLDVYGHLWPNSDEDVREAVSTVFAGDRNQQKLWEAQ